VLQLIHVETRRDTSRWINECEIVFETVHTVTVSCAKICIQTRIFTGNLSHGVFTSGKTIGNFHSDSHSTSYVKRCTGTRSHKSKMAQRYRTQNNKGLEHAASSDGAGVIVVVKIDCGQSFFVVSLLGHRGQSSWSVFIRGQSLFLVFVFSRRL